MICDTNYEAIHESSIIDTQKYIIQLFNNGISNYSDIQKNFDHINKGVVFLKAFRHRFFFCFSLDKCEEGVPVNKKSQKK